LLPVKGKPTERAFPNGALPAELRIKIEAAAVSASQRQPEAAPVPFLRPTVVLIKEQQAPMLYGIPVVLFSMHDEAVEDADP
jgi:hypothetical protein